MRTIDKAVFMQTIQRSIHPTQKEYYCSEDFLVSQGRKNLAGTLEKYIVYQDKSCAYWTERYWYFDVEKYQSDLQAFGVDVRMAVKTPMGLPNP